MPLSGWTVLGPNYGGEGTMRKEPAKFGTQRPDLDTLPLPPLAPALPVAGALPLQNLFLSIVVQALVDDDLDFVISPTFVDYLLYIGLSPAAIRKVRMAYLRDEIDPARLALPALNAPRSFLGSGLLSLFQPA